MSKKGGFGRKTLVLTGLRAAAAVLGYAVISVLALQLDADSFGHYGTIMAGLTVAGVFCRFGTDVSLVRFLGLYRAEGRPGHAAGAVVAAQRLVLGATLGLGCVMIPIWLSVAPYSEAASVYIIAGLALLPAFALSDVNSASIRSYGRIFMAIAPRDVLWRIAMLGIVAGLWLLDVPGEAALLPFMGAATCALIALVAAQALAEHRARRAKDGPVAARESDWPVWRKTSATIWVMLLARVSLRSLDVLIVGAFIGVTEAGVYFLVSRTAELMGFLLASLNLLVGPIVARGHAEGNTALLHRRLAQVAVLLCATSVPVFLALVLAGPWFLARFGPEFAAGYGPLILLGAGQLINALAGSVGVILNMTGHERENARVLLWSAPISAGLLLLLTPQLGMVGAALGTMIGLLIWNIWVWIEVRRHTVYDPSLIGALRYYLGKAPL